MGKSIFLNTVNPASGRLIALITIFSFALSFTLDAQKYGQAAPISAGEAALLLSEYIRHSSVSGNEKPAGEFFAEICRKKGLNVKVLTDNHNSYNFAASLYPLETKKPNIIFLNHIDVVHEGDASEWKYEPFSGMIAGDTVWGRGAIDMKGVAVMQLLATCSLETIARENDLPVNVTLLCVSGEEKAGILGAKLICESWLDLLNPEVIIGEGGIGTGKMLTGSSERNVFAISVSDKRALWIKLSLTYKSSGHGAVPPPDYANKIMINALNNLAMTRQPIEFTEVTLKMLKEYGKIVKGLKGFLIRNPRLFKPLISGGLRKNAVILSTLTNTITVTSVKSDDECINQIPQSITARLDCRLLPGTATNEFLDLVRKITRNDDIQISLIGESADALPTLPDKYFTLIEKSLSEKYPGAGIMTVLFPATTDNNYFRAKGISVYGFIPVVLKEQLLKTIHNNNERIAVESLVAGSSTYSRFLELTLEQ